MNEPGKDPSTRQSASLPGRPFGYGPGEWSGAFGDLGTLLPLTLGAIAVAGLAPTPVFLGFAAFLLASALIYRLPVPVQPMKAVAAVMLTTQISPEAVALSGVLIGIILLGLGATGWISRVVRLVPQSVLAGLQLGLGMALAIVAFELMASAYLIAAVVLVILAIGLRFTRVPALPVALVAMAGLGMMLGVPGIAVSAGAGFTFPAWPGLADWHDALANLVLPQLALTFTNAILLTALIAGDHFREQAAHVTPRRLCLTTGFANLALTPFGALPMCHGAGGLAAHHRFGARSGGALVILAVILAGIALAPGDLGYALLAAIPPAGLGALLLFTAGALIFTRRVFDSRPSCWPVIAATGLTVLAIDPFWGLVAGMLAEAARTRLVRAYFARRVD
ncbi:MAG: putative sulfate/molybdate transporter [Salinarimonas sp.]|nr:putative sulfate/molybdate transporter [Salinarimonas sp.]